MARNMASASAESIITRDLSSTEKIALLHAIFPNVQSILVTDVHGTTLSEVVRLNGQINHNSVRARRCHVSTQAP